MKQSGIWNKAFDLQKSGLGDVNVLGRVHWNYDEKLLQQTSLERGEGVATDKGALLVTTGQHTGRSANDKFIVRDENTENTIWWDNNKSITSGQFDVLHEDFIAHTKGRELFVQDLYGGADPEFRIKVRVITEFAWHSLFIRHLLRRPEIAELAEFVPEFTIIDLPSFKADSERHGLSDRYRDCRKLD